MSQAAFRILSLAALLWSGELFAQGQSEDINCLRQIDSSYIYFTAFQPGPGSIGKKFCQEIPTVGKVITSIDYADPGLRQLKTEVRIIAVESWDDALDEEKDAQAKTVVQIPAKTYPQGTITVEHVFDQPGYFVEVLTIEDKDQKKHIVRFPIRIGVSGGLGMVTAIAVTVLVLALAWYFVVQKRRSAYRLAEAEKESMIKEAERSAEEEKKRREKEAVLNAAYATCYQAEKTLAEFGDKLTEEVKKRFEGALRETQEAVTKRDAHAASERAKALEEVMKKAERQAAEEKRRQEEAEKLSTAFATCDQAEKTLAEFGDKLTEEVKKRFEGALRETQEAVTKRDAQAAQERAKALEEMIKAAVALYSRLPGVGAHEETLKPAAGPGDARAGRSGPQGRKGNAEHKEK